MTNDSREPGVDSPIAKRLLLGDPLTSEKLEDQLLPKKMALPIFASDALSSVAYAPQDYEIAPDAETHFGATGDVALILVNRLQKPVLKAIDYAIAARHETTLAVHIAVSEEESERLQRQWAKHGIPIPLVIVESPYRTFANPVSQFITQWRAEHGSSVVTVYLPRYIVGHWWESLLHNRRARRIAHQLMLTHGVSITLVPWLLDSSELIYGRRSRPLPRQDRSSLPAGQPALHRRATRPAGPPTRPRPPDLDS